MTSPAGSDAAAPARAAPDLDRLRIDRSAPAFRRRRRLGPWIALLAIALGVILLVWLTMGAELTAPRVATARVVRVAATEGAVKTTASGYVVARRRASISSRLSGRLERLEVDVGDAVKAGQLLGQLGCADLDAAVDQAKAMVAVRRTEVETLRREAEALGSASEVAEARRGEAEAMLPEMQSRLADAERTLRRETALEPGLGTSQEALDRSLMERDVARQKLEQVEAQIATLAAACEQAGDEAAAAGARVLTAEALVVAAEAAVRETAARRADADIVAPFAGRVLRKEAEIGEMVAPVNAAGSSTRGAIVTLADFATLEMEVEVIERDIGGIDVGGPCRVVLDSRRDHPYAGFVRQIVPTADRTKSTVQVKVAFKALDERVWPEMSGRVEFLTQGDDAVVLGKDRVFVAKTALVERDGRRGAFEVRDGRAVFRDVTSPASAAERDGAVEVEKGLVGGEDVIVSPPAGLADGALVRVAETSK